MKPAFVAVCCLLIAMSMAFVFSFLFSRDPHDIYLEEGSNCLGEWIAEETLRLMGTEGEVAVLASVGPYELDSDKPVMDGFQKALRRHRSIRLVMVDPPDERTMIVSRSYGITEAFFTKALREHPQAKAIVSFLGLPIALKAAEGKAASKLPRIIAFDPYENSQWNDMMRKGIVSAVIRMRPTINDLEAHTAKDCAGKLAPIFGIITQANLKEMEPLFNLPPSCPDWRIENEK